MTRKKKASVHVLPPPPTKVDASCVAICKEILAMAERGDIQRVAVAYASLTPTGAYLDSESTWSAMVPADKAPMLGALKILENRIDRLFVIEIDDEVEYQDE